MDSSTWNFTFISIFCFYDVEGQSRPTTAAERRMTQSANFFFSPKVVKPAVVEEEKDQAKEQQDLGEDSDDPEDKALMEQIMERQQLS